MGDSIAKTYHMVAGRQVNVQDFNLTLRLREHVLRGIVANNADVNFVKTHNIRAVAHGVNLIPDNVTRQAIYILRNPLDTLLSYGRHYGMTVEDTVTAFGRSDNANAADEKTVTQFLGSWSEHVKSWESSSKYPSLVVRYEDMLETPHETFGNVLKAIGLDPEEDRLDRAIRFASFDELSKQEEKSGFVESSPNSDRFFAKGKSGQWKTDLPKDLVDRVRRDHKRMMKKYGYYNV